MCLPMLFSFSSVGFWSGFSATTVTGLNTSNEDEEDEEIPGCFGGSNVSFPGGILSDEVCWLFPSTLDLPASIYSEIPRLNKYFCQSWLKIYSRWMAAAK